MKNFKYYFYLLLAAIIPAILLTGLFDTFTNSLYHNGAWLPSKITLKKGVLAANDFYYSRNTLARGHLHLGSWHGFQEVVFKTHLDPAEISFDFFLSPRSYAVFEFNRNAAMFSGIRISQFEEFKDIYFTSTNEGGFLYVEGLNAAPIKRLKWNHMKVV